MKNFIPLMLCAALWLSACESENGNKDLTIQLADGTTTTLVLDSETSTTNQEQIKFTATAPWTAWIKPVTNQRSGGSEVDWLTLNTYSGDAGEYTLTLTISPNLETTSRKAEITIECGGESITITVEQAGTTSEVTTDRQIKEIQYSQTNQKYAFSGAEEARTENITSLFSYDSQNRVTNITRQATEYKDIYTFTYTNANEIQMKETETGSQGTYEYETNYIIQLNDAGNATSILHDDKGTGTFSPYINFNYTDDGRLAQIKDAAAGEEGTEYNFTYDSEFLSAFESINKTYESENISYKFSSATDFPNQYLNKGCIDIMGFLLSDDDSDFLFHIGRLGNTGKYMPEHFPAGVISQYDKNQEIYREPGIIIPKTDKYIRKSDKPNDISYTFDEAQYVTSITIKDYYIGITKTYNVVVGNEYINPEDPDRGYKYTIENEEEKSTEYYDTTTYKITYN